MAPGFPVAGGSQVLGSVNSGVAPWQARLVPNVFRWSTDFSRRSHFRGVRGRQVFHVYPQFPVLFVPSGLITLTYLCRRASLIVSDDYHLYVYRIWGQHTPVWGNSLALLTQVALSVRIHRD